MEDWKTGTLEDWKTGRLEDWKTGTPIAIGGKIGYFQKPIFPSFCHSFFHCRIVELSNLPIIPSFHHSILPSFQIKNYK